MTTSLEQYRAAAGPLTAVLDAVPPGAWSRPSPCAGWNAADVVDHLVTTQRDFLLTHGAHLGDALDVPTDPAAAFRAHTAAVETALADDTLPATEFAGFFGPTTVGDALVTFYVWDLVVHRWDVAAATGAGTAFTAAELDRVEAGIAAFGGALHADGICGPALPVPDGADRTVRLLAELGRAPGQATTEAARVVR